MENESEWEPSPEELRELNSRELDEEIHRLGEIWMLEKHFAQRADYLQELAEEAWFHFVTIYSKNPKTANLFVYAVSGVLPHVSDRIYDKRNILKMMFHEVASRLSKMIWANRKRKEKRRKEQAKKRTPYAVLKERRKVAEEQARDVLLHGTRHGEFYLPGIVAKSPPRITRRVRHWAKRPIRQLIPREEQLGSLLIESEVNERRQNCLRAFGYVPEEKIEARS